MNIQELWRVSPRSFIFIRKDDGTVEEYKGIRLRGMDAKDDVISVEAKKYPMYDSVLEVVMEKYGRKA